MGQLSLTLMSAPRVYHAGKVLIFPTRKALALLIYLAVEKGFHSREKLADLFWPTSDSEHARIALRRTLVLLRQALIQVGGETSHVLSTGNLLGLNFEAGLELDLDTLAAGAALARKQGRATLHKPDDLISGLARSAEICRGDFLEGFSLPDAPGFDEWVRVQQEGWRNLAGLVLDSLSSLQAEAGETLSAINTVTRWMAYDPYNELSYRRLMSLYFTAGNRAAALQTFQACKQVLSEFGAKPEPDTEKLAQLIRAGVTGAKARGQPNQPSTGPSPSAASLEAPLTGRSEEFSVPGCRLPES